MSIAKGDNMICANQSCAYHQKLPVKDKRTHYVMMIEDGDVVCVNRHMYRSNVTEFYLCDICHEAVQMVVGVK